MFDSTVSIVIKVNREQGQFGMGFTAYCHGCTKTKVRETEAQAIGDLGEKNSVFFSLAPRGGNNISAEVYRSDLGNFAIRHCVLGVQRVAIDRKY